MRRRSFRTRARRPMRRRVVRRRSKSIRMRRSPGRIGYRL